ncbi:unnamed protein product [Adineta steineri]|uniref:Uncharacterized protein n=1 Tax=Adineta steineri TaxID=433720 RepID=A0A820EGJ2_9BILA|nr:unnamed protein product [Adineta steineri]
MNLPSRSEIILSKINKFYQINVTDSDEIVKYALQQLLQHWSGVLEAATTASDDELFFLNCSRAFLTNVFTVAWSKDLFKNDHSFTRQVLRTSFDLLINHIDIYTNKTTTFLISNINLIMVLASGLISILWCSDIDLFNDYEYQLLLAMRKYVDQDFTHDDLTDGILSFVWNLSDSTILIPLLLKAGYAKSLIEWINTCQTKFRDDKQIALLSILLNMIRHDDGIDKFRALNTLNAIQNVPIEPSQLLQRTMVYILLTDVNQLKLESTEILNMLVQLIIDAANSANHRYDGSHICEPLTVLTKLFYNDEILIDILNKPKIQSILTPHSFIELFISLLIKFYENLSVDRSSLENFTCTLILNILWLISFHQEYYHIIYNNAQLMNIIKSAANNEKNFIDTFMPRTMKNIQQAAIEILKNYHEKF